MKIFNSIKGVKNVVKEIKISNSVSVRFRNDVDDPAEILLYDEIGKDPWSGAGISAADFSAALKEVPRNKTLNIRINSPGGDVHDGMAIYNLLNAWPNKVTAIIDGVAASTASWIPLAADEIEMPETAQMFIHDAMAFCVGNAGDMEQTADMLNKTSDQIAGMYAEKNGKSVESMRQKMRDETLMTGSEAHALGLVDVLTKKAATRNFSTAEIASMRNKLNTQKTNNSASPKAGAQPETQPKGENNSPPANIMKRTDLIALLNKFGVKFDDKATDEQLLALVNALPAPAAPAVVAPVNAAPDTANLQKQIDQLTEANNAAKKMRIENSIQAAIDNDQLPAAQKDAWVKRAMVDETVLNDIAAMPSKPPGADNLSASRVELTGESFNDVQKFIVTNGPALTRRFVGAGAGRAVDNRTMLDIRDRALKVANAVAKHRNMIISMFNTNTIDSELQRTVIMGDFVRAFAVRLLPTAAFCKTWANVPLEGTDKVAVPYFALSTTASTDWVAGNGYVATNTAQAMREVTVNKRKYQAMAFTSQELRRQPYQNWQELAAINAEKLGVDVNADILSIITVANYGASVKAVPAAAFGADDLADLYGSATDLNWPDEGRSLVLTTGYKVGLLKDPGFKYVLNAGSDDALRRAAIKSAYGFEDIYTVPTANLPSNAQNLTGFICHKSAALVATAPIMPAPAVRALMVQYDLAIDPASGIAVEYKLFGNAQLDNTIEVAECNYGYAAGVQTALARITSQ